MTEIYGYKWERNEGPVEHNGKPTKNMIRWCRETSHFTREHWERAFNRTIENQKQAVKEGTENSCFPPASTVFVEYGRPPSRMYQVFDSSSAVEAKPASKEHNIQQMSGLLGMFD